jgi:hypothetical protein
MKMLHYVVTKALDIHIYLFTCVRCWALLEKQPIVQSLKKFPAFYIHVVTCIPLLGNDSVNTFPCKPRVATIGHLSLGNGAVNTTREQYRMWFPWGWCRGLIKGHRKRDRVPNSSRVESEEVGFATPACRDMRWEQSIWTQYSFRNWLVQNTGKKGTRLCKDDFRCDLKWPWDFYKSVARINYSPFAETRESS